MEELFIIADGEAVAAAQSTAAQTTTVQTVSQDGASAQQANQQAAPAGGLMSMLPLILIIIVFMFFVNRSQKKQQQRRTEVLNKIMKGDRVITNSGVYGTIAEVKEDSFILEIADKVRIEITKNGVAAALPKEGEVTAEKKDK